MADLTAMMQAAAGAGGAEATFIEDVFSTYLYTGNGSTQTITNGIDLAGEGGLVWIKMRNDAYSHRLIDTTRGVNTTLSSNLTAAQSTDAGSLTAFNSNGFSVGAAESTNLNTANLVSWTFREQPKFFDVVTYTGNDTAGRTIAHNLGSVPGMIIIKRTSASEDWAVYHRSLGGTKAVFLNRNFSEDTLSAYFNNTNPTSTVFTVGDGSTVNASGSTYVAYLFAHDAGGFGSAGTDNVISCGSFNTGAGGGATVNLGYEPQWLIFKGSSASSPWYMFDNMRGWTQNGSATLQANTSGTEFTFGNDSLPANITSTGFNFTNGLFDVNQTWIYMAIRRPMKPPTTGTEVFSPIARTGTNATANITTGFVTDSVFVQYRAGDAVGVSKPTFDRLRGIDRAIFTDATDAESTLSDSLASFASNTGYQLGTSYLVNDNLTTWVNYAFRRASGFFDEVCYTGTGSATTQAHNLGVVPELMIVKRRSATNAWAVYANNDNTDYLVLNTNAATADDNTYWNDTTPTSTVFSVGTNNAVNASASTYVAYLFATVAGVSKVGSYTGTGATQTINAALPTGARFVLIKRTDSTGDWWVWDTARGMVSGTDPRLALNSTAAESNNDWVYTVTNGFQIVTSDATVNASGGNYIYLAIA